MMERQLDKLPSWLLSTMIMVIVTAGAVCVFYVLIR